MNRPNGIAGSISLKSSRLDSFATYGVAFDLETHLIQPGLVVPPIVCGSVATNSNAQLLSKDESLAAFIQIVQHPNAVLIGGNIPYDIMCEMYYAAEKDTDISPYVLAAYDPERTIVTGQCDGRVYDIQVAEALHAVGRGHLGSDPRTGGKLVDPSTGKRGRYSVSTVVDLVLGRKNAKANAEWRMSFALLEHLHPRDYPATARAYMLDDVANPLEVALAQAGLVDNVGTHEWRHEVDNLQKPEVCCSQCGALPGQTASCKSRWRRLNTHEISRQCYADFCLKLGAAWGFAVDHALVDDIEREYNESHDGKLQPFIDAGIVRPDGTENQSVLKKLTAVAYIGQQPDACVACNATGKVPSPKTEGRTKINCDDCNGTGYTLTPEVPRTDKGQVAVGADALVESGHELLIEYAAYNKDQKVVEDYIPFFRQRDKEGNEYRGITLTLRPNVMLENGRVSYDGKIMMLPRHGRIRNALCARLGRLLSTQDYEGSELIAHAQSCLWIVGASRLAQALNAGLNAHLSLACQVLAVLYEEAQRRYKSGEQLVIDVRQICKPGNFGFMGRMGEAALVRSQRKQNDVHTPHPEGPSLVPTEVNGKVVLVRGYKGLRFCIFMKRADRCGDTKVTQWKGREYPPLCKKCLEAVADLKRSWLAAWPENVPYFEHVKRVDDSGLPVVQHVSKRLRGFKHGQVDDEGQPINSGNAIANTYFSGLIADAAKNALCAISRECYDKTHRVHSFTNYVSKYEGLESPLYGSRIPVFQHDETIGDHPESIAADAATRQAELMEEALRIACPDMHKAVKVQPTLMRRWDKRAQPVYVNGRLVPWESK